MKNFMPRAFALSLVVSSAFSFLASGPAMRAPSSADGVELHLQTMKIDSLSRLSDADLKGSFLRATFPGQAPLEFGKGEGWALNRGEARELNLKIDVRPSWLSEDSLQFKLELVRQGTIENILVRCAHVSKDVNQFNRGLQCMLPGENQPFLTFRLAKRDASVPVASR